MHLHTDGLRSASYLAGDDEALQGPGHTVAPAQQHETRRRRVARYAIGADGSPVRTDLAQLTVRLFRRREAGMVPRRGGRVAEYGCGAPICVGRPAAAQRFTASVCQTCPTRGRSADSPRRSG
jgi:hypothetical protein